MPRLQSALWLQLLLACTAGLHRGAGLLHSDGVVFDRGRVRVRTGPGHSRRLRDVRHPLPCKAMRLPSIILAFAATACAASAASTPAKEALGVAVARERLHAFECADERADTPEAERQQRERRAAGLRLAIEADHIRFIRHGSETDDELFATRGKACTTAKDPSACEAELARLETLGRSKKQVFAITIASDQLKLYEGREVLTLVGVIDSPERAWLALMIHADASSFMCKDPDWHGYREVDDGFELSWVWTDKVCRPFQRVQAIEHVDRDGQVTRLRTQVVEHDADACIIDERPIHRKHRQSAVD